MRFVSSQPKWLIALIGLVLVFSIGTIDYFIRIDISLSIFYLFPIILVTWFTSRRIGGLFCILSAILWFWGDTVDKTYEWFHFWNAGVRFGFFITITYLLGELKIAYDRERRLARTDGLTGITNRRFFLELLYWEVQRFQRYHRPFTLAYLDVDNFKTVNDEFGHSIGDKLLCLISDTIEDCMRTIDTVARLGGDEFALLLPETNYEAAQIALSRLQHRLLAMVSMESFPVSFSIGAITFLGLPESIDQMLEKVDNLMYDVKNGGKNGLRHEILHDIDFYKNLN